MNQDKTIDAITRFISRGIEESGATGAVIGLSGGIDSAVTAYLTVAAIGSENVLGVLLPVSNLTPGEDTDDAIDIVDRLGIDHRIIEIGGLVHTVYGSIPDYDADSMLANGNLIARMRMSILYYYSNLMNRLVIGTGNRTELLLGYATKYGDSGVDLEPIGDLYKTEVFELARYLGVPERVIRKPPSARLWMGQTDEQELGMRYQEIDRILKMIVDYDCSSEEIIAEGVPEDALSRITGLIDSSEHKRHAPPHATITDRNC